MNFSENYSNIDETFIKHISNIISKSDSLNVDDIYNTILKDKKSHERSKEPVIEKYTKEPFTNFVYKTPVVQFITNSPTSTCDALGGFSVVISRFNFIKDIILSVEFYSSTIDVGIRRL